jgi:iron complex transport system substrate-binding protein
VRVCSLLPSATEIVFALGKGDSLVGVSHECDYPPATACIPKVTRSGIAPGISSTEIDRAVAAALGSTGTLYELDIELLGKLRPDLILTQRLCDVCAVSYDRVQEAVKSLQPRPRVINLEPLSLADILQNVRTVAEALRGTGDEAGADPADALVLELERRINRVRETARRVQDKPRVVCLEWVDPPYCGGHWMKELVEIAGGRDDLANPCRPSYRIDWKRVVQFEPDVIVLTCCGFNLKKVQQEGEILTRFERFYDLPAARSGRVYATDGSAYFSRPGPRIADSLEILAYLIHPEAFHAPSAPDAFSSLPLESHARG